jgi:hypothetical protein
VNLDRFSGRHRDHCATVRKHACARCTCFGKEIGESHRAIGLKAGRCGAMGFLAPARVTKKSEMESDRRSRHGTARGDILAYPSC